MTRTRGKNSESHRAAEAGFSSLTSSTNSAISASPRLPGLTESFSISAISEPFMTEHQLGPVRLDARVQVQLLPWRYA
jgi:hypothetical protein